ncbi:uncharacterized protein LOC106084301 [Stomoxys calcitrans]|uniref:uncharacterized protein LOC106084301 n=1 Tax=Stomoxys calcitrans TaxID=35570 RepID=UPI0027E3B220|nr:uncharacterized protein LOC106084301 [Stomoxys calcitrans]
MGNKSPDAYHCYEEALQTTRVGLFFIIARMCNTNTWQAPLWLDNAYLEKVLRSYLKDDNVTIVDVNICPVNPNGENYASVMSRIKITFKQFKNQESQQLSFILKYSYESDAYVANIMNSYDVYNTEMKMYEQILPQLAKVLQESGDMNKLCADTLKVDYERSTIIFEDLSVQNYVMANRQRGLDMLHASMVMKKLGKFHAAGAVLNEKRNGTLQQFDHGIFNRHSRSFGCIFENFCLEVANFAKDSPDLGIYYHDKLTKLSNHIVDYGIKAYTANPHHFYTLSHGDLWTNNIMMRYDKANEAESIGTKRVLKDIMFIDFQLCNWSLAAVDLHYFFNTSLESNLLMDSIAQANLVQLYHSELSDTLKKLGYDGHIPTLREIWMQLEESKILALIGVIAQRPIMTSSQSDDADIHSLLDDDERARNFRKNCVNNKDYQIILKNMLPVFDRRGLLDLQK